MAKPSEEHTPSIPGAFPRSSRPASPIKRSLAPPQFEPMDSSLGEAGRPSFDPSLEAQNTYLKDTFEEAQGAQALSRPPSPAAKPSIPDEANQTFPNNPIGSLMSLFESH